MVVLNRLVIWSLNKFASKEKADDIAAFFKDKDIKGFDRGLNQVFYSRIELIIQSLDLVNGYARWVKRDAPIVEDWLKAKGYMK